MQIYPCCQSNRKDNNLTELARDYFDKIRSEAVLLNFHKGQIIFYEGHIPYGVFLLQKGQTTLIPSVELKKAASISPGSLLGLHHFLLETPYCSTCQAITDVEVLFFPKSLLKKGSI